MGQVGRNRAGRNGYVMYGGIGQVGMGMADREE